MLAWCGLSGRDFYPNSRSWGSWSVSKEEVRRQKEVHARWTVRDRQMSQETTEGGWREEGATETAKSQSCPSLPFPWLSHCCFWPKCVCSPLPGPAFRANYLVSSPGFSLRALIPNGSWSLTSLVTRKYSSTDAWATAQWRETPSIFIFTENETAFVCMVICLRHNHLILIL